jgi:hypothetical protein
MAAGGLLSVFLVATVNAAPAGAPDTPKQKQGITNAKKSMQSKLERDKKMNEVRKKGQALRRQAQAGT